MTVRQAPLGVNQIEVLRCLDDHGSWPGGWIWGSASLTRRILDSLARRGLVDVEELKSVYTGNPYTRYTVGSEGRAFLTTNPREVPVRPSLPREGGRS
jgi:hypothetical protein